MLDSATSSISHMFLFLLRLFTLLVLVLALTIHLRSVRVFRWEQSVSGGVLVTFCIAVLGLALCSINKHCGGYIFQGYIAAVGAILLSVNSFVIWRRWRDADEITHVVAELLQSLGMPLSRHVKVKIILSAIAAVALLVDLIMTRRKG